MLFRSLGEQWPVGKRAIHCGGLQTAEHGYFIHALVAADVLCHLHVIVVGPPALHGSNGAVELCVVLVNEVEGVHSAQETVGSGRLARGVLAAAVTSCSPLVPVVEVDELGIDLQCLVPSILEVDAVLRGIDRKSVV